MIHRFIKFAIAAEAAPASNLCAFRMKFLRSLLTCSLLACSLYSHAQTWRPYTQPNSAEILHRLQKLQVLGSCLYIAAHPDDENTRLLAWLANEKKVRTGYLSLTRGDGGQNLIGPEQGEALGLIRTQELLAARRIDGAEQFFTRAYDFGYSKTPEETFRIWNRDSVLADVVWVIRQFRPDVIITRFPTTGEGGHGHHTASAMLAVEAFDAAADPKRFPEQLQYVSVWQPRRLFWNTFNFGGTNTTDSSQLKIDVGGYNPLLGKSYGEIAAEARSMHKSQGFGTARQRGSSVEYFKLLKGDAVKGDLFEGIDLMWRKFGDLIYQGDNGRCYNGRSANSGLAGLEERSRQSIINPGSVSENVTQIIADYDPMQPDRIVPNLVRLYSELQGLRTSVGDFWPLQKMEEVGKIIQAAAGLSIEELASTPTASAGSEVVVTMQSINRGQAPVSVSSFELPLTTNKREEPIKVRHDEQKLLRNTLQNDTVRTRLREWGVFPTDPYWLQQQRSAGLFKIDKEHLVGLSESHADDASFLFRIEGEIFGTSIPIVYKTTDPVKGEIYRPFEILPPVTANFSDKAFVFESSAPKQVSILVQSHGDSARGKLELGAPQGWNVSIAQPAFSLKGRGAQATILATVTPTASATDGMLRATLLVGGERYTRGIRRIEYDHIPAQFYLPPAEARLVPVALKTGGKSIGYIKGAGDDVPAALRGVGYTVTELDEAAVAGTDLSRFSAIVTGVRAYNTQEWLQAQHEKLAAYVRAGGNLVVQYNTNNRIGPVVARIAPDTFTITRDRITDETAAVNFLAPAHPALNVPNKISSVDFDGWIQERSIYHASNWAPSYIPILSMADPGEKPSNGALIIAPYGKGNVVYTGLAFFRELPAGVPGAFRLFANLLALPSNK